MDEWDLCLEECLRVLKPGGFLEYFLFDNDIINPGPLGQNLTKNFTSQLGSMGYDPTPTSRWISRLNKAGYGEIKRGWIFCPMSPPAQKPKVPSKEDYDGKDKHGRNPSISSQDVDTVKEEVRRKMEAWEDLGAKKGSTENAAPVSGLLGSWIWEKWMLKTNAEARHLSEWELAMNQIGGVLEEGKERGSGWRCMVGWARKPLEAPVVQAAVLTAGRFRADSTASIAESRTAGRLRADSAASIAESRATGRFRADSTTSTAESRKTYYSSLSRRN